MIPSAKAAFLLGLALCAFGCQPEEPVGEAGPPVGTVVGGKPKGRKTERPMENPGMGPNGSMTILQRTRPDSNPKRKAEPIFFGANVKPEMTGAGKLKADGALVEVAGTCDVSPSAVTCWKQDGTPNQHLSKILSAVLRKPSRRFQHNEFVNDDPNGQKVRGVAIKVTPSSSKASSLMWIVHDNAASPMSRLPFEAEGVKYGLAVIRVAPSVQEAAVSVALSSPTSVESEILCDEGAQSDFDGQELGVTSIREAAARIMAGPGEAPTPVSEWRISLRFKEAVRNYENVTLQPKDKSGRPILFSDPLGNPTKKGRPAISAATVERDGTLIFTTTVVPTKIGKLVLRGNRVKVVEITGVRLDPAR